jgi:hypothetical protein
MWYLDARAARGVLRRRARRPARSRTPAAACVRADWMGVRVEVRLREDLGGEQGRGHVPARGRARDRLAVARRDERGHAAGRAGLSVAARADRVARLGARRRPAGVSEVLRLPRVWSHSVRSGAAPAGGASPPDARPVLLHAKQEAPRPLCRSALDSRRSCCPGITHEIPICPSTAGRGLASVSHLPRLPAPRVASTDLRLVQREERARPRGPYRLRPGAIARRLGARVVASRRTQ